MIPIQWNKKLIMLAVLGIILYFGSNIALSLLKSNAAEGGLDTPAVKPAEAGEAALQYAASRLGLTAAEPPEAALLSDKRASGFIAKHNLRKAYEEDLSGSLHLDYWLVSAGLPNGEKIRLKVGLEQPEVLGWELLTEQPNQAPGNGLALAEEALRQAGYNLQEFATPETQPASSREAASFTFVSRTLAAGEAPLAVTVKVSGDRAVAVTPGLQMPQAYLDWMDQQERIVRLTSVGFLVFTAIMGVAALVLAIVNRKRVSWSRGLLLTGIFLALFLLQNLNVTQAMLMAETNVLTMEALAAIIMNVIIAVLALLLAVAVWFSLLSGEEQLRRLQLKLWPRWRDPDFGREMFYGMGRGYLICLFILGVQQAAFLIAGLAFDSFSINDPSQSTWNMKWAVLFPASAWVAAIMEEAIYRVFGIAVLKRLFRFTFPAVLVSSFIWGLGHTGYSIFPSYTRLIEVTVLGLIFGYVFLRYGFFTAVFAHAIMDSLLMSIYLVAEQPTLPHILAGVFYILLPALIGFIIRYLHPRFGGPRRHSLEAAPPPYGVPQE